MTECEKALTADIRVFERFLIAVTSDWASALGSLGAVVEMSAIKLGDGRRQKSFKIKDGWQLNAARWAAEQNQAGANTYWVPQPKKPEVTDRAARDDDILCLLTPLLVRMMRTLFQSQRLGYPHRL